MSSAVRKPFYLRPPWNILFELNKLEKLKPWNVNISYLLRSFLSEMVKFWESGVSFSANSLA